MAERIGRRSIGDSLPNLHSRSPSILTIRALYSLEPSAAAASIGARTAAEGGWTSSPRLGGHRQDRGGTPSLQSNREGQARPFYETIDYNTPRRAGERKGRPGRATPRGAFKGVPGWATQRR